MLIRSNLLQSICDLLFSLYLATSAFYSGADLKASKADKMKRKRVFLSSFLDSFWKESFEWISLGSSQIQPWGSKNSLSSSSPSSSSFGNLLKSFPAIFARGNLLSSELIGASVKLQARSRYFLKPQLWTLEHASLLNSTNQTNQWLQILL